MEDFKSDLDALRIKRAAYQEQLKRAKATPDHYGISFNKLTHRLQPSKRPWRTETPHEMHKQLGTAAPHPPTEVDRRSI